MTEKEKMKLAMWYDPNNDTQLVNERLEAQDLCFQLNQIRPKEIEKRLEIIEKILVHIIEHEKGIEHNTSSFRYNLKDLMPSKDILKFYKELNGEIITIGSDSHNVKHLGYKINEMKEFLKSIGCKNIMIAVFGYNANAIKFYEGLGFEKCNLQMLYQEDKNKA